EEARDAQKNTRKIDGVVESEHYARAQRCVVGTGALESKRDVDFIAAHESTCCAAEQNRLQLSALRNTAGEFENVAKGCAEWHLINAGAHKIARYTEQLRSRRAFSTDLGVLSTAHLHDKRHVAQRLNVVDHGRLAEEPGFERERRLGAR